MLALHDHLYTFPYQRELFPPLQSQISDNILARSRQENALKAQQRHQQRKDALIQHYPAVFGPNNRYTILVLQAPRFATIRWVRIHRIPTWHLSNNLHQQQPFQLWNEHQYELSIACFYLGSMSGISRVTPNLHPIDGRCIGCCQIPE
jgi:hypothetical protein